MKKKKNLMFNLDKLIWVRLDEGGYISKRIVYREEIPAVKFLGITIQKQVPANFINIVSWNDSCVQKEELEEKYFIGENNVVTVKPHLRLKFQGDLYYEEFYDTLDEAQEVFDQICSKYPNLLQCK